MIVLCGACALLCCNCTVVLCCGWDPRFTVPLATTIVTFAANHITGHIPDAMLKVPPPPLMVQTAGEDAKDILVRSQRSNITMFVQVGQLFVLCVCVCVCVSSQYKVVRSDDCILLTPSEQPHKLRAPHVARPPKHHQYRSAADVELAGAAREPLLGPCAPLGVP